MSLPSAGIFSARSERFLLGWPVLFLILAALEKLRFIRIVDPWPNALYFLSNIVFFNVTHLGLTYALFLLPEMDDLLSARYGTRRWLFWFEVVVIHLLLIALMFSLFHWASGTGWLLGLGFIGLLIFNEWIPLVHTVTQFSGIAAIYDFGIPRPQVDVERERAIEKKLFYLLSLLLLGRLILDHCQGVKWLNMGNRLWCATDISVVLYLFYRNIFIGRAGGRKLLYLVRCFALPFFSDLFFLGLFLSSVHGIEYAVLFRQMRKNSRLADGRRIMVLVAVSAVALTVFCAFRPLGGLIRLLSLDQGSLVSRVFFSISLGLGLGHYYLDHWIFRMSHPLHRKHLGPLLPVTTLGATLGKCPGL